VILDLVGLELKSKKMEEMWNKKELGGYDIEEAGYN
jgi:hypothetical protein